MLMQDDDFRTLIAAEQTGSEVEASETDDKVTLL